MTEDNQGLSSEELLRQAREHYGNPASPDGARSQDNAAQPPPSAPEVAPPPAPSSPQMAPPVTPASPPLAPPSVGSAPPPPWSASPAAPTPVAPPPTAPTSAGPPSAPSSTGWFTWRRALAGVVIIAGVIGVVVGAIANRETTSAGRLDVGDCFENPGGGSFSNVNNQNCAEPHDVQAFAEIEVQLNIFGPATECEREFRAIMRSDHVDDPSVIVPDDVEVTQLRSSNQNVGRADVLCIVESPSGGLVGSVLPE